MLWTCYTAVRVCQSVCGQPLCCCCAPIAVVQQQSAAGLRVCLCARSAAGCLHCKQTEASVGWSARAFRKRWCKTRDTPRVSSHTQKPDEVPVCEQKAAKRATRAGTARPSGTTLWIRGSSTHQRSFSFLWVSETFSSKSSRGVFPSGFRAVAVV